MATSSSVLSGRIVASTPSDSSVSVEPPFSTGAGEGVEVEDSRLESGEDAPPAVDITAPRRSNRNRHPPERELRTLTDHLHDSCNGSGDVESTDDDDEGETDNTDPDYSEDTGGREKKKRKRKTGSTKKNKKQKLQGSDATSSSAKASEEGGGTGDGSAFSNDSDLNKADSDRARGPSNSKLAGYKDDLKRVIRVDDYVTRALAGIIHDIRDEPLFQESVELIRQWLNSKDVALCSHLSVKEIPRLKMGEILKKKRAVGAQKALLIFIESYLAMTLALRIRL